MLSSPFNTEADVAGEVLAPRGHPPCASSKRCAVSVERSRKPDALLEAIQRKQEAAPQQLSDAQDRRRALRLRRPGRGMSGFVALALQSFESNKSLLKRLNAMIDLLGQCARSNEIAREIVEFGLPPPTKLCAFFCRIPAKPFLTTVKTSRAAGRARPVVLRDNTPVSERCDSGEPSSQVLACGSLSPPRFCRVPVEERLMLAESRQLQHLQPGESPLQTDSRRRYLSVSGSIRSRRGRHQLAE